MTISLPRHAVRVPVLIATAFAVFLAGCASTPSADQAAAGEESQPGCNPLIGAGVGAVIGAIANKGKGAAVGAAVGALGCMAINALTKKTKPAAEVEEEYKQSNNGALPPEPVVSAYNVAIQPGSTIKAGQPVSIISNSEVVGGTATPITEIREELVLLDPTGKEQAKKSKVLTESSSGAGGYENQFSFKLPQGVPQGAYTIRTTLYVNGTSARVNDSTVQLVFNRGPDAGIRLASAR